MKAIFILTYLVTCGSYAAECVFTTRAKVISETANELHQVWIEEDHDTFHMAQLPNSNSLQKYLASIKEKISDLSPKSLLRKEYNDFMSSGSSALIAEAPNMLIALDTKVASLQPATCLEALLLSQQTDRSLSWERPMEFSAFILHKFQNGKPFLKIYFSTNDRPGGKINSDVISLIQEDTSEGWELKNHLHNHTFNTPAGNGVTLVGGPSPGLSDVSLYREFSKSMGLKSASVTNGFDTVLIDHSQFDVFHAHE